MSKFQLIILNSTAMQNFLRSYQLLSEAEIESLGPYLRFRRLEKGDYLIKAGRICTEIAFVQSGLLRSYFTSDDGEEITYCFTFENTLMTAYSSLITGLPSPENIQALMPTELWVLQKRDLGTLAHQSINWVLLQKHLAETPRRGGIGQAGQHAPGQALAALGGMGAHAVHAGPAMAE